MATYNTREEFAEKAGWEGGLLDFIFDYGVSVDDIPEEDTELREALAAVLALKPAVERLEALLPEGSL